MHQKLKATYYALSMFLVGTAFFLLQPTEIPEMQALQNNFQQQFSVAWKQTLGDQPWFPDVAMAYETTEEFYSQAADVTVAMLSQPEADADIARIYTQVYNDFALAFGGSPINPIPDVNSLAFGPAIHLPPMPENFMIEEPVFNLIPNLTLAKSDKKAVVAGTHITTTAKLPDNPWVTVHDASTGQSYCLAIWDGTVNKYLGPCADDYY